MSNKEGRRTIWRPSDYEPHQRDQVDKIIQFVDRIESDNSIRAAGYTSSLLVVMTKHSFELGACAEPSHAH